MFVCQGMRDERLIGQAAPIVGSRGLKADASTSSVREDPPSLTANAGGPNGTSALVGSGVGENRQPFDTLVERSLNGGRPCNGHAAICSCLVL